MRAQYENDKLMMFYSSKFLSCFRHALNFLGSHMLEHPLDPSSQFKLGLVVDERLEIRASSGTLFSHRISSWLGILDRIKGVEDKSGGQLLVDRYLVDNTFLGMEIVGYSVLRDWVRGSGTKYNRSSEMVEMMDIEELDICVRTRTEPSNP